MAKKRWSELTPAQRTGVVTLAAAQVVLAGAAWYDLARRPASGVRGPKAAWALAIAVNWVGPISYFAVGRLRPHDAEIPAAS